MTQKQFLQAVKTGNLKAIAEFLKKNGKTKVKNYLYIYKDEYGQSPLHIAVINDKIAVLKELLKIGANPAIKNKDDLTAIQLATISGSIEAFSILYKTGILLSDCDKDGNSLFLLAAKNDKWNIVKFLISNFCAKLEIKLEQRPGATSDLKIDPRLQAKLLESNKKNITFLHYVAKSGKNEILTYLLDELNMPLSQTTPMGNTMLHLAVAADKFSMVYELVKRGADLNSRNKQKQEPRDLCQRTHDFPNSEQIINLLNSAKLNKIIGLPAIPATKVEQKKSVEQPGITKLKDEQSLAAIKAAEIKLKEETRVENLKLLEERRLAEQKILEEKRLAEQKLREENRLKEQRLAEQRAIAEKERAEKRKEENVKAALKGQATIETFEELMLVLKSSELVSSDFRISFWTTIKMQGFMNSPIKLLKKINWWQEADPSFLLPHLKELFLFLAEKEAMVDIIQVVKLIKKSQMMKFLEQQDLPFIQKCAGILLIADLCYEIRGEYEFREAPIRKFVLGKIPFPNENLFLLTTLQRSNFLSGNDYSDQIPVFEDYLDHGFNLNIIGQKQESFLANLFRNKAKISVIKKYLENGANPLILALHKYFFTGEQVVSLFDILIDVNRHGSEVPMEHFELLRDYGVGLIRPELRFKSRQTEEIQKMIKPEWEAETGLDKKALAEKFLESEIILTGLRKSDGKPFWIFTIAELCKILLDENSEITIPNVEHIAKSVAMVPAKDLAPLIQEVFAKSDLVQKIKSLKEEVLQENAIKAAIFNRYLQEFLEKNFECDASVSRIFEFRRWGIKDAFATVLMRGLKDTNTRSVLTLFPDWMRFHCSEILCHLAKVNAEKDFIDIILKANQLLFTTIDDFIIFLKGKDASFFEVCGKLLMFSSIAMNAPKLFSYLLNEKKLSPLVTLSNGDSLLHHIAHIIVNILQLKNHAKPEETEQNMSAIELILKELMKHPIDIDHKNNKGETAIAYCHVPKLLEFGANPLKPYVYPAQDVWGRGGNTGIPDTASWYKKVLSQFCEYGGGLLRPAYRPLANVRGSTIDSNSWGGQALYFLDIHNKRSKFKKTEFETSMICIKELSLLKEYANAKIMTVAKLKNSDELLLESQYVSFYDIYHREVQNLVAKHYQSYAENNHEYNSDLHQKIFCNDSLFWIFDYEGLRNLMYGKMPSLYMPHLELIRRHIRNADPGVVDPTAETILLYDKAFYEQLIVILNELFPLASSSPLNLSSLVWSYMADHIPTGNFVQETLDYRATTEAQALTSGSATSTAGALSTTSTTSTSSIEKLHVEKRILDDSIIQKFTKLPSGCDLIGGNVEKFIDFIINPHNYEKIPSLQIQIPGFLCNIEYTNTLTSVSGSIVHGVTSVVTKSYDVRNACILLQFYSMTKASEPKKPELENTIQFPTLNTALYNEILYKNSWMDAACSDAIWVSSGDLYERLKEGTAIKSLTLEIGKLTPFWWEKFLPELVRLNIANQEFVNYLSDLIKTVKGTKKISSQEKQLEDEILADLQNKDLDVNALAEKLASSIRNSAIAGFQKQRFEKVYLRGRGDYPSITHRISKDKMPFIESTTLLKAIDALQQEPSRLLAVTQKLLTHLEIKEYAEESTLINLAREQIIHTVSNATMQSKYLSEKLFALEFVITEFFKYIDRSTDSHDRQRSPQPAGGSGKKYQVP